MQLRIVATFIRVLGVCFGLVLFLSIFLAPVRKEDFYTASFFFAVTAFPFLTPFSRIRIPSIWWSFFVALAIDTMVFAFTGLAQAVALWNYKDPLAPFLVVLILSVAVVLLLQAPVVYFSKFASTKTSPASGTS